MNRFLIFLLLAAVGCKKSSAPTGPSFRFKANGVEYLLNDKGAYFDIGLDGARGCHIYGANGQPSDLPSFIAVFTTDSVLQEKTYYAAGDPINLGATCRLPPNAATYTISNSDTTNVTVTIITIQDNTASGTFSAHLDPSMTITDGQFERIPIVKY